MNTSPSYTPTNTASYPKDFQQVILEKSQDFVGRKFVFTAISEFIHRHKRGYFTIVGAPGSGKSAILAKYARDSPDTIYYNAQIADNNHADKFLRTVCTQLMQQIGNGDETLPDNATEGSWFLSLLLQKVSDELKPYQNLIITIDAIDTIDLNSQPPGSNLFYLPRYLPKGVYFLLTRRPFKREKSGLLIETPSQILDLAVYPQQNQEDVRAYIRQYITPLVPPSYQARGKDNSPPFAREGLKQKPKLISQLTIDSISEEEFITHLTTETENNFMYLSQILPSITEGFYPEPSQHHPRTPPLETYYQQHWQKMTNEGLSSVALEILRNLIFGEQAKGISAEAIAQLIDEDEYEVEKMLENWLEFLVQQQVGTETRYSFYHDSFRYWLAEQLLNG